jgi:uncharacterized phage protein (TIGR02218 family)
MADAWLTGPVTSSAFGWRLERRDGVTLGFTSHDRDVEIDGLTYRASPGLLPTSVVETSGLDAGGLEVKGALTADALRAEDLRAGIWDGASLDIFLFDWSDPDAGIRPLASGTLGAIEFSANSFSVDIEGPAARLSMPVAPFTSPTCRARFCDAQCGLNAQRFRHRATAIAVNSVSVSIGGIGALDLALFEYGELRWLGGRNCGKRHMIVGTTADSVVLERPPSFEIDPDTPVELLQGCDKLLATCAARFGNVVNFRGEPHLPGNDLLTRFPGG